MKRPATLIMAVVLAGLLAAKVADAAVVTQTYILNAVAGFGGAPLQGTGTLSFTFDDTVLAGGAGTITPSDGLSAFSVRSVTFSDALPKSSPDHLVLTFGAGDVLTGVSDMVGTSLSAHFNASGTTYSVFQLPGAFDTESGTISPLPEPAWATLPGMLTLVALRRRDAVAGRSR